MTTKATDPSERTSDMSLASPKESLELENLDDIFARYTVSLYSELMRSKTGAETITKMKQAITALHDAEIEYVIGPDSVSKTSPGYIDVSADRLNQEKAEQRQRWQERRGK